MKGAFKVCGRTTLARSASRRTRNSGPLEFCRSSHSVLGDLLAVCFAAKENNTCG
jgi:hypothetical protein